MSADHDPTCPNGHPANGAPCVEYHCERLALQGVQSVATEDPPRDVLRDLLTLVLSEHEVPPMERVEGWPVDEARVVEVWAAMEYLRASDNEVDMPPRPDAILWPEGPPSPLGPMPDARCLDTRPARPVVLGLLRSQTVTREQVWFGPEDEPARVKARATRDGQWRVRVRAGRDRLYPTPDAAADAVLAGMALFPESAVKREL